MTQEQPLTKSELLDRMRRSREALLEAIDGLSDEELEARDEGEWAVIDHLAHIAAWERGVADYLRGRSRAEGMGLRQEALGQSIDEVNEKIYRQTAALSVAQARQMFDEAHEQMLAALEDVTDDDLLRTYNSLLPEGEPEADPQRLVLETIQANTYEHYDEHLQYMQENLSI